MVDYFDIYLSFACPSSNYHRLPKQLRSYFDYTLGLLQLDQFNYLNHLFFIILKFFDIKKVSVNVWNAKAI